MNSLSAQEKTNNLDFSLIKNAPTYFSQIDAAKNWRNANLGTSDLFHKKSYNAVGIPNNNAGSQEAFSGDSYAGIIAYDQSGSGKYTEYIQTRLENPLTKGKTYAISFMVSLADKSGFAISGLGAYISKEAVSASTKSFISAKPQIISNEVINNTKDWVKISGKYTATGNENYITFGAFNSVGKTAAANTPSGINSTRAYYYIDGIQFTPFNEPDTDGDGIIDKEDTCPKQMVMVLLTQKISVQK